MKLQKILLLSLLVCLAPIAYAQRAGKDFAKKIQGVWIAQGIILKNIPTADKDRLEKDVQAINQTIHNRLAFAFAEDGTFKSIMINDNKKVSGKWNIKGKILSLLSENEEFNNAFKKVEVMLVGDFLDIQMVVKSQDDIKKYKPFIRLQKGEMSELDFNPKKEQVLESAPEELKAVESPVQIPASIKYKTLTLAISPTKVDCNRPDKFPCLQVRDDANQPWSVFQYKIEGFEHEEGFEYVAYVSERTFEQPPFPNNPQKSFYTLVKIVSKTKK